MQPPSFYLAVVDALSQRETERESSDGDEAGDDSDGLEDGLGNQPHALLWPNAKYEVIVRYDGDIGKKRDKPEEGEDPNEIVVQRSVMIDQSTYFYGPRTPAESVAGCWPSLLLRMSSIIL